MRPPLDSSSLAILSACVRDYRQGFASVPGGSVGCEIRFVHVDEEHVVVECPNPEQFDRTFASATTIAVTFRHGHGSGSFLTHVLGTEPTGQVVLAAPRDRIATLEARRAIRIPVARPSLVRAGLVHRDVVLDASVLDATAHGLGLRLDPGQVAPTLGSVLPLYVAWPRGQFETLATVMHVHDHRCGVHISLAHSRAAGVAKFVRQQFVEWYRALREPEHRGCRPARECAEPSVGRPFASDDHRGARSAPGRQGGHAAAWNRL